MSFAAVNLSDVTPASFVISAPGMPGYVAEH